MVRVIIVVHQGVSSLDGLLLSTSHAGNVSSLLCFATVKLEKERGIWIDGGFQVCPKTLKT
jgi:hypothetical protein